MAAIQRRVDSISPISAFYKGVVNRKTFSATGESEVVCCAVQPMRRENTIEVARSFLKGSCVNSVSTVSDLRGPVCAACQEDEALGESLSRSVQAITGEAPCFEMRSGLLETRFYAAAGIPAYAYCLGFLSVAPGPNEYLDLRKVIDCASIYALTAIDVLRA